MSESIVAALNRRRLTGGYPFDDGLKIALVAEGGAMRGVFVGGMVSGIEANGYTGCFDLMIGSSAGAGALAYLRAGQARFGTRMFYEDLNTGVFIRKRRALAGGDAISIDYLIDEVFARRKELDTSAFAAPGAELFATATDIDSVESVLLSGFEDRNRALEILRATSRMPLVSGPPVMLDGRRLLDGGLLSRIPTDFAIRAGATHVLVLLNRSGISSAMPLADRLANALMRRRYGSQLSDQFEALYTDYADDYARLTCSGEIEIDGARVLAIHPEPGFAKVGRTTQDGDLLRQAAAHGEARLGRALLGEHLVDAQRVQTV